ncbi:hypothetical protein AB4Y89_20535 [Terriglobus sp. 2YAB30_2]|uniref:hypothetical protein n=1 Tax=Terriglobus sp. 2YAB30_2 TaxID=3233023 RepID=UPI003F982032
MRFMFLLLMASFWSDFAAAAQAPAANAAQIAAENAAKQGIAVSTASDLSSTVSVEAVLLPYSVVKRTFGKEVAEKYAVVSLTVSNRDPKQGVVLQSVFLDYSRWLFSGVFAGLTNRAQAPPETWQQQSQPSQVASAEVRTVRTDFQDAQLWSTRSWVIHIASAVGAAAGAVSFSTASDLFAPSVAAFNGNVVPALGLVWPDNSQSQLNLLNDIGFRTNHVIAAKSADIVVAFFPTERFLTPTLHEIYKKAPAAFFNPSELVFERSSRHGAGHLLRLIEESGLIQPSPCGENSSEKSVRCTLVGSVTRYEVAYEQAKARQTGGASPPSPCADEKAAPGLQKDCLNVALLNRASLNNIRVVVGGIMTVDVSSVPAIISSVQIQNDRQLGTWKSGQTITGTVTGTFLSGGALTMTMIDATGSASTTALASVKTMPVASSDTSLSFSAVVGANDITPGAKISFSVTKTAQDKSTTSSAPFVYVVSPE